MYACTGFNYFFACFSLRTKNNYIYLFCAAGFFRFFQKARGFFCQRNASVDLIDFMLVQPNVLQQDDRIPTPLECYIKCLTTLNFLNNKFPPLENIRTSKCSNYAREGVLHLRFDRRITVLRKAIAYLVLYKTNNECFYSCNGKNIFIR